MPDEFDYTNVTPHPSDLAKHMETLEQRIVNLEAALRRISDYLGVAHLLKNPAV